MIPFIVSENPQHPNPSPAFPHCRSAMLRCRRLEAGHSACYRRLLLIIAACYSLPATQGAPYFTDNFDSGNYDASTFNSTLTLDQWGTIAPLTYTTANSSQGWQIQHGNGGQMLLAGWHAGISSDLYASLNHNFAVEANFANLPLCVRFDLKVTEASHPTNWAAIAIGSAQNVFISSATNKFGSFFRLNGATQQIASGNDVSVSGATWTPTGSTITVVLSNTAGTGSPFNGSGSVAKISVNGTLVGTRTLAQMAPTDGFISFEAYGAMAVYDNLEISTGGNGFTWAGGDGNWSSPNWNPGSKPGPTSPYESAVIRNGNVHVDVPNLGNIGGLTLAGGTLNTYNWNGTGTYTAYHNLVFQGGSLNGIGSHHNWGAAILGHVTVNGRSASSINSSSFFNLNGTDTNSSVFDVSDVTGNADPDLSVSAVLADVSADYSWNPASLLKIGTGTLKLAADNSYSGGTTVNAGTLALDGASGGNSRIRGALVVNAGATAAFTGSDGTGLGWNNGAKITSLAINGGTVTSPGMIHVWNLGNSLTLTGGTLQSNNGTSDAAGPQLEWSGTTITSQASANPSVIAGRIRFRPDAGTLHTIDVADGAASTDLLISAALTESSRSNLVKTGAGTLRITGAVQITGTINVEAGTLDFAPSSVSQSLRISVADDAKLKLSNPGTTLVKNVYLAGQRLASGTWGAPGSGAANVSSAFTGTGILQVTDTDISNRERWKRMKYGQFTHYVWDGGGWVTRKTDGSNSPNIDFVADNFNATKYADDLQSMGVEYVIFTAWHANFNPLFNSSTFDKYGYWYRHSQRDMLGDMITAVRAKGIRVLFYTHPNQPIDFNWWTHNNMINDIFAEMIDRYGDQIDGFYMDENDPGGNQDGMVDFVRLGQTIHRRNPDLMLIQNFYGNLYCNSVPMGESGPATANFSKDVSWPSVTSYAQVMSNSWSAQVPVTQYAATRSAEGIFRGAVTAACSCTDGGGTAWAAGPYPGGLWERGVLEAMQGAGALLAPVAESVKNTYPSNSFTFSGTWGGATRSVDDTKEYIHVLWPPSGNTLTLPAPADGKVFANARLLANGQPVTLKQNGRTVRLTLTGTNTWDANDTVIAMDVVSAGDPYLANNTTPDATYTGSWVYSGSRATGEFGRDVHSTTVNGDFVEYKFNGTDIELVVSCGPNRGTMDIYVDGVFKQSANATDPTDGLRKTIYRGTGHARGNHTLKVVKTGGTYLAIDAFKATELIDSADPDVGYQALTFFNNTDTTPNPVGYIEYGGGWSWQQRDRNEYNYDVHWSQWNGSTFWIHFNGTGVQFIGTYDGIVDFYLDEVFVKRVNMKEVGGMARCLGLDIRGLPAGNHTLKGVKAGDTYLLVDAFFVYNSKHSSWSSQTDSASLGGSYRRSSAHGDAATLAFKGTGIEIIAPHQPSGGTVAVDLQGSAYQTAARQFVSQNSGAYQPQNLSFSSRNVTPLGLDNYSLSMSHNRSFGSIAVDAFRVYKNRPGSGPALKWGSAGGGGSGTWDVNTTANWWDGANATAWYDFGASDYAAVFQGSAGNVNLATNININRITFATSGYHLQNNALNFTGRNAGVTVIGNGTATLACTVAGSGGFNKDGSGTLKLTGINSYSGGTTISGGTLESNGAYYGNGKLHGTVTVNPGATLALTGGDGTGFGWNDPIHSLTINGGAVSAPGASHIGFGAYCGVSLSQGGSITGNWQWNGDGLLGFSSTGDSTNTISGSLTLRSDSGANHTFNVANGTAATDLQVNANLSDQWPEYQSVPASGLVKTGAGTMVLAGTNTFDGATTVSQGVLSVTGSVHSTSSIQIAAGAELHCSGTLQTSGNVTNSGTLVFSGSAGFSAGGTIINYGTIINNSPALLLPANLVNYGTVLSPPGFFNNTTTTPNGVGYIEYDWNWSWQWRDRGEYDSDAHWASANGSTFRIHFNGTGVQFIGTYDGIIDFYLDDVFVRQVNMKSIGGMSQVVGIDIKNLPAGKHVLKGVKAGDTYALIDGFFVYKTQYANSTPVSASTIVSRQSLVAPDFGVSTGETTAELPAKPIELTATANGTSAVLAWTAVSGATSYQVKQGSSASGPFSVIGSPTTNSFAAASLTGGTTYYFVVSAVNAAGEGADSSIASCTIATLPFPWVTADIGSVGIAGSASAMSGVYTVNGSGTGVYASSDKFRMVYQNSTGDCQLIARVDSLTAASTSAKAGVMIRESLSANSRCAGVYVTPTSGVQFIWRTSTGSMVKIATAPGITAPRWVRIQRVGNSFRAFHSANGSNWTQFGGNKTISMSTSTYLGQAVTSGTNSAPSTGVFSNVTATP